MIRTTSSTKRRARPREQKPAPPQNSYRCPACGEMVENGDADAVRFHHYHVLHPRPDRYVTLPFIVSRAGVTARQEQ